MSKSEGAAWVDPVFWRRMDAQEKGDFAAAVALYVSPGNPVVDIYDAQSARKLARFGSGFGFTVY